MNIPTLKPWQYSIISGILIALPWLFPLLAPIALIGFVPLFYSLCNNKSKTSWLYPFLTTTVWLCLTTTWLYQLQLNLGQFLLLTPLYLLYATLISLPIYLSMLILKKWDIQKGLLVLPFLFAGYEWSNNFWDLSNNWLNLRYAFSGMPMMLGFMRVLGWELVPVIVMGFNVLITLLVLFWKDKQRNVILGALLGLTSILISLNAFAFFNSNSITITSIASIQPNFNPYQDVTPALGIERLRKLETLTRSIQPKQPSLVVWHETCLQGIQIETDHLANDSIVHRLQQLSGELNTPFLFGTFLFQLYPYKPSSNFTAEPTGTGEFYDVYNTGLAIDSNHAIQTRSKVVLLPFVERLPFISVLASKGLGLFKLGESYPSYAKGKKPSLIQVGKYNVALLICNESMSPYLLSTMDMKHCDLIVTIANDGWAGNTGLAWKNADNARLLAIEFNKPVLRCANNGKSMMIAPNGDILTQTDFGKEAVLYWAK